MAFEGVGGAALDAPQHAGDAPASPPPAAATTVAAKVAPATAAAAEVTPVAAAAATAARIPPAPLSPAAIVIDDSPPEFSPRAGGRECSAEIADEGRPEKRPRTEVPPY
ncbi:hypothetical protein AAC387_Pa04g1955 [Persea americana]